MEQWLEPQWWQQLYQLAMQWWVQTVMVPATLIQLVLMVISFLVARRLEPTVNQFLARLKQRGRDLPAFQTLMTALMAISLPLIWVIMQWLAITVAEQMLWSHSLMTTISSLLAAWVVIRLASHWLDNPVWSRLFALVAWSIAALNILALLPQAKALLDGVALSAGDIRVSALTVIQGFIVMGLLLWLAISLTGVIEKQLRSSASISPAARVLISKFVRIALISAAIIFSLDNLGLDLTALAVFSGALAVGLGFGLQKIFSNLVSGVILLLDKSIKPGDVIALGATYGWINHLGARYVSVITRDGVEHLIPNEELITQRVENWTHTDNFIRLKIPVSVSYQTDPRQAMQLCVEAAQMVPRVLLDPEPTCQLRGFGDSALNLELRLWMEDPENGRGNLISEVLLNVWDRFKEHGIEIPYPQQDLHLRSMPKEQTEAFLSPTSGS
ncbi:MAG: mechanosensitive ion channel [Gammaproteobacteria bacterium]|nr:mechanosensitive ion channel [Gammaproteobacteria bacterium]